MATAIRAIPTLYGETAKSFTLSGIHLQKLHFIYCSRGRV